MSLKRKSTLLITLILLISSCSIPKHGAASFEKKLTKKLRRIKTISPDQRDSLSIIVHNMVSDAEQVERDMFDYIQNFITLDKKYSTSREEIHSMVDSTNASYIENISQIVSHRVEMRKHLTEDEWKEFSIVKVRGKK